MPMSRRCVRPPGHREVGAASSAAAAARDQDRQRSDPGSSLMASQRVGAVDALLDWLDSRTGWRTGRRHLLEEPIPAGVGWWFVTGSVLLMLLAVQLITGVVLAMYYVPSPEHAYDSIRYIMERLTFGRILRGLHFFGASFIVVAAVTHMLRVVVLGSYNSPRGVK